MTDLNSVCSQDEAVRGTLITQNGELLWPAPRPPTPPAPKVEEQKKKPLKGEVRHAYIQRIP